MSIPGRRRTCVSYTRSECIAADGNKACIWGDLKEQWPGNGLGLLGTAKETAKGKDGSQPRQPETALRLKRSRTSLGIAKTNIHLNSSPLGKRRDPISTSRDNRPSPPGHSVVTTSQRLPGSSPSLPKRPWALQAESQTRH